MKKIFCIVSVFFTLTASSQDFSDYRKAVFNTDQGSLQYRILYPVAFDTTLSYPLLIFLHGAYEKGRDNEAQLNIGGRYFLR